MFIDVRELRERQEPFVLDRVFRPEELELKDQLYTLRSPVRFSGLASVLSDVGVRIQGSLGTLLDLVCSRCLKNFQQPLEKSFDLVYMPNHDGNEEVELSYGDLEVGLFSQQRIDLDSV